jgi:hypothetical protein
MDKKNTLLLIVFLLLLGCTIGMIFERIVLKPNLDMAKSQEEISCFEDQASVITSPPLGAIYQADGTIIQKGDDFLIVEAFVPPQHVPLPGEEIIEKQNIKIYVSEETDIFLIEIIDPVPEGSSEPFKKLVINFEDLEINDHVLVTSEEDIKNKEEFVAQEIQVFKKAEIITPKIITPRE